MDLNELLIQLDNIFDQAQLSHRIPGELKVKMTQWIDEISFYALAEEVEKLTSQNTIKTNDDSMIVNDNPSDLNKKSDSDKTDYSYK